MRHEVAEYYEQTYRQVDQQLEGAQQLVAQRTLSPARPYPVRPKNRVSMQPKASPKFAIIPSNPVAQPGM